MYSTCPKQCVHYPMKHFERLAARDFLGCLSALCSCLSSVICSSLFFIDNYYPLISKYLFTASPLNMSTEEKMEVDNRSIYVGNVSDNA
jgi:hypothetical protein